MLLGWSCAYSIVQIDGLLVKGKARVRNCIFQVHCLFFSTRFLIELWFVSSVLAFCVDLRKTSSSHFGDS